MHTKSGKQLSEVRALPNLASHVRQVIRKTFKGDQDWRPLAAEMIPSPRRRGGWLDEARQSDVERLQELSDKRDKLPDGEQMSESDIHELDELTFRLWDKREMLRRDMERDIALHNCGELVRQAVEETLKGDQEWGAFLGEMIPFLTKRVKELGKNEMFKARFREMKFAQRPRKKGRTLRSVIEEIIQAATWKHEAFSLFQNAQFAQYNGSDLSQLPEFSPSSADQWFEEVIWPEVNRRKDEGSLPREIMELKKANRITGKRSGKFQLSDLKEPAHDSVKRLAKAPHRYCFPEASN